MPKTIQQSVTLPATAAELYRPAYPLIAPAVMPRTNHSERKR